MAKAAPVTDGHFLTGFHHVSDVEFWKYLAQQQQQQSDSHQHMWSGVPVCVCVCWLVGFQC